MKSIFANVLFCVPIVHFSCEFVLGKITYNTYPNIVTRATTFSAKIFAKTCLLKPDEGPCRSDIKMYYFDPKKMSCSTFEWGGCQGNGNRFDTEAECLEYCLTKPYQKSRRPRWCDLTFDYGFCFGALERWYYDRLWKVCKKTLYSGCGGNKNNFYSQEQCDSVCRFGTGRIPVATSDSSGLKKVIIINPWDTTPRRGRDQSTRSPRANTTVAG